MTKLTEAIIFAAKAHDGQLDKNGCAYILHPLRVAAEFGDSEEAAIAAVLHDLVEDTPVMLGEIRDRFTDEIADAVDALTRREDEEYFEYIERLMDNDLARRVKAGDLRDNLRKDRIGRLDEEDQFRLGVRYREALEMIEDH